MLVRIQPQPSGTRHLDAPLCKGQDDRNVVAVLTGSNYHAASRIWLDAWRESSLRKIVYTGSGVSLAREALPSLEMKVAPIEAAPAQLHDVNGGLLPITGTVPLKVRIGTQTTSVLCGVVRGMSVPLLLVTDYTDDHVPKYANRGDTSRYTMDVRSPFSIGVRRCRMPIRTVPAGLAPQVTRTPRSTLAARWLCSAVQGLCTSTDGVPRKWGHYITPPSV